MNLTHHRETLPTSTPVTGPGREQAATAARAELAECRALLSIPGPLLASPRMRRRYLEALAWNSLYTEQDVAA